MLSFLFRTSISLPGPCLAVSPSPYQKGRVNRTFVVSCQPTGFPLTIYQVSRIEKHVVQLQWSAVLHQWQGEQSLALGSMYLPKCFYTSHTVEQLQLCNIICDTFKVREPLQGGTTPSPAKTCEFTKAGFRTVTKEKEKKKSEQDWKTQPHVLECTTEADVRRLRRQWAQ